MTRDLRRRFWLLAMDVVCLVPGGYGSRVYWYALRRAADATGLELDP